MLFYLFEGGKMTPLPLWFINDSMMTQNLGQNLFGWEL